MKEIKANCTYKYLVVQLDKNPVFKASHFL